ncbi:MvdC/MvdD family ATP grasp protein [Pseudoalteromonas spongiae]|uniref:MvdD-like pre-ATP grasp domain-containing protein n=1 Tax=Pseudoalteromonas spongiae TaxID=298657 RepID=A0ABU8EVH3_9GAMM
MKKILVISNSQDCHVVKMVDVLKKLAWPFFIVNLDRFPLDYRLTQEFSHEIVSTVLFDLSNGESIDFNDVGVVWNRKPAPFSFSNREAMSAEQNLFATQETEHALFSALYLLECHWFNHPKYLRAALWKGEQLKRAQRLGFMIPDTIISNDPTQIRRFYKDHNKVVYKVLSDPFLGFNEWEEEDTAEVKSVPTTEVSAEMLEDSDSLNVIPNQFQEYIEKAFELRVIIIGDNVYCARIDSQSHPDTKIDCRNFNVDIPYSNFKLPAEIENKCLRLTTSYQLMYSAIDLIVTPQNEYVFLENNPCGQYLFVENRVLELSLTNFLAKELIRSCKELEAKKREITS